MSVTPPDLVKLTIDGRSVEVAPGTTIFEAARRHGIHHLILPKQNEKHVIEDLTDEVRRGLTVHYVSEMDEVLALALTPTSATTA